MNLALRIVTSFVAALGFAACASAAEPQPSAEQLFAVRVLPMLKAKCVACHGADPDDLQGGLDVTSLDGLKKGGESGEPAVVAGKPDESPFYVAVTRKDFALVMPPKENDKLAAEDVDAVRRWIAGGAPWPNVERLAELAKSAKWAPTEGVAMATSGGLSPDWTNRRYKTDDLWAYQPVRKSKPPQDGINEIDAFVNERLTEIDLAPGPLADAATLCRRLYFDLTGLPPTPEELETFVSEFSPSPDLPASRSSAPEGERGRTGDGQKAYEALVDKLLASPHYGEHMARHWLDVVRYADTSGFANDYDRGNAWRYRDYVVRAFNDDKPYDQFIREQIAGDEINANDPELLVAVGFLRMGPWELTGMEVAKLARQRFLDDVTNAVGETFLSHSLQCARCHDHKFDPVPTRDYYSIQACFATTQLAERPAAFLPEENVQGFEEQKYVAVRRTHYQAVLDELGQRQIATAHEWLAERKIDPKPFDDALAAAGPKKTKSKSRGGYEQARAALLQQGVPEDQVPPRYLGFSPQDFGLERVSRKGLERLAWEAERYQPIALSVYDGRTPEVKSVTAPQRPAAKPLEDGELEATAILGGGDPFSPTLPVDPGVLSVLASTAACEMQVPTDIAGRRRALAEWIADPRNPLTTRSIVNRVWLWHFGQPLAGNPNNFGATGKRPTHPELLDWLAATLVEDGWSLKQLHRRIVLSAAYRRSCDYPNRKDLAEKDPLGIAYAAFRPRRLTAEELRDAMLHASGELNRAIGGIPVRPEMNLEAALQPRQVMGTFAAAWTPNPLPQDRNRRSLYALKIRGLRDPLLEVFNEPTPDLSCEAREASTVTPQVFALFNGKASYDRALALAAAALRETASDGEAAAVDFVFRRAIGRSPNEAELKATLEHWRTMTARQATITPPRYEPPREVVREAVEENTGEKFTFVERLDAYDDFVPDLQAADVNTRTRGLADVCLAIFNSNEFVYIY